MHQSLLFMIPIIINLDLLLVYTYYDTYELSTYRAAFAISTESLRRSSSDEQFYSTPLETIEGTSHCHATISLEHRLPKLNKQAQIPAIFGACKNCNVVGQQNETRTTTVYPGAVRFLGQEQVSVRNCRDDI